MTSQNANLFPEPENQLKPSHATGILPSQEIERLIESNRLSAKSKIEPSQIQPASMDLRLGATAYRVRASFLPGAQTTVATRVADLVMHEIDLSRPAVLEKGCVYIVPLMETVQLPAKVWGKANPKSTTGRLDVFTRLITDYATEFEIVKAGYAGALYVEIVPRTFSILVHEGTKLNQLRFMRGEAETSLRSLRKLDEHLA